MMEKEIQKRILLAIDGSDGALEAVRYVSMIAPFKEMGVVLFTVYSRIPESYWDLERGPELGWRIKDVRAWEREYERGVREYMDKSEKILWRAGFPKDAVKVNMREREKGIARDIIKEAQRGYAAVVVGRKGMSRLKDLILGSTSTKLLEKLSFVPFFVVGEGPEPGAVLLAFDGSEGAMRAVDCVGSLLGSSLTDLALAHVIRAEGKGYVEEAKEKIAPAFDEAKARLLKAGFESNQLSTRIITGVQSRAGALVEEAQKGRYGTIVLGRRGLSKVKEFFIGRVSNKVIQMAKGQAVWVVG